jgi:hypothetical protein
LLIAYVWVTVAAGFALAIINWLLKKRGTAVANFFISAGVLYLLLVR